MDLPEDLVIVHQPVRLRLMGLLLVRRDVSFAAVRDALGITDGNLASHAKRLENEGLLESRRALGATGVVVRYQITQQGDVRMHAYITWLRACLAGLEGQREPHGPGTGSENPPRPS